MDTICSGCSLAIPGGTLACRAIFDDYIAGEWNNPISYRYHRMFVDTYCLQHPGQFCVSAKSFAAHLTGLCTAFEHKSHPSVLNAVNRWLSGNPSLNKPELPSFRGALTIAVVCAEVQAQVQAQVQAEVQAEVQAKVQPEVQAEVKAAATQPDQNPFPIAQAIDRWARSTWEAYSPLHSQARLWISQSFSGK